MEQNTVRLSGCVRELKAPRTSPAGVVHRELLLEHRSLQTLAGLEREEERRAQEVMESLATDVLEELGHAQQFGTRIKELYGIVPGSEDFRASQSYLQPPADPRDLTSVIRGVIEAETGAINHYNAIIEFTAVIDPVTADMVTNILHDEEGHRRLFEGFLREFDA